MNKFLKVMNKLNSLYVHSGEGNVSFSANIYPFPNHVRLNKISLNQYVLYIMCTVSEFTE